MKITCEMFEFFKKMFIGLLSFSRSLATKCMSLNNEQCKTRTFIIDLNPVDFKYSLFMVRLVKCNGRCNTLSKICGRICFPNKTEDINLSVFNLITRKIEPILKINYKNGK